MDERLPETPRVVLYRRSSAGRVAADRQRAIESRLDRLSEAGGIESVEVRTWPKVLEAAGEGFPAVRETLDELFAWADRVPVLLGPFYEERPRSRNELLELEIPGGYVLPVTALFVYDEAGELAAAYPHTDDHGPRSVSDAVRTLSSLVEGPEAGAETEELTAD